MPIEPFKQPTSTIYFRDGTQVVGTVTLAGPELLMPVYEKTVLFEMHRYHGPMPLCKRDGSMLLRIPRGFWDAFERWKIGGQLVEENVCIVSPWCETCEGSGLDVGLTIGTHAISDGPCKSCNGGRLSSVLA